MENITFPEGYSLADKVFKKLEEDILNGTMAPGENLTEIKLSQTLGVSRTPVREAIHRLEQEGLVELTPNKGAVVIGVSEQDLQDVYVIRTKLEGLAARWAAEKISPDEITRLTEIVDLQEFYTQKGDTAKLQHLDSQFHDQIYRISGSKILRQTLAGLHHAIKRYRKISISYTGRAGKLLDEHRQIVTALENHDPDTAERVTITHIKNAGENMQKALDPTN